MSGSRSSVERLFSPPAASDVEMLQSDAPGPSDSSFHGPSSPSESPLSPLPESPPRLFVELPLLSPTSKSKYTTDFSERVTMLEEAYPEREMDSIIGEYSFGRKSSYFVKLSTGLAVKVSILARSQRIF
ncbi:hypothetical protein PHLCEN_2v8287 [Hermanssonia centrifuga]|uniref:Uncharacterized protein n=1 Tax=Hermanssonia centrifuga TaxID=98765 RepID=A0A2R6NUS1_9APHY|nr:hypothetical protein PHLCEN_2v8287 [Hermanssonia centrifuga]